MRKYGFIITEIKLFFLRIWVLSWVIQVCTNGTLL